MTTKPIEVYEAASGFSCDAETFRVTAQARLVFADPELLFAHFGSNEETGTSQPDHAAVRSLLQEAGSVVSEPHCADNDVNAAAAVTSEARAGYRPPNYGRSALFEDPAMTAHGLVGLLDVKGCGVAAGTKPHPHTTRNGVLFLHDALVELINYQLLNRLFRRDEVSLSTVPFYAIVETGVRARPTWSEASLPCATLVRKALVRQPDHNELPSHGSITEDIQLRVECYLLTRGLTTTGPVSTVCIMREDERIVLRLDGFVVEQATEEIVLRELKGLGLDPPQILHFANIQMARDAAAEPLRACLVDLGHVRACNDLSGHLGIFVTDRQMNWGRIVQKRDKDWPWRSPDHSVDPAVYGPQLLTDIQDLDRLMDWLRPNQAMKPTMSGVLLKAMRLAMRFDSGAADSAETLSEIESFVDKALPLDNH